MLAKSSVFELISTQTSKPVVQRGFKLLTAVSGFNERICSVNVLSDQHFD